MAKTIIVSGFFSAPETRAKLRFFERVEAFLKQEGYELLLVNFTTNKPETRCKWISCPSHTVNYRDIPSGQFLTVDQLAPDLVMAAAVDAEANQVSLVRSGLRISLLVSFLQQVHRDHEPVLWVMWHKFNGNHHALTSMCRRLGTPHIYTEYGILPGTISFDVGGQMGESWVAQKPEMFDRLRCDDNDLKMADRYLEYARGLRKNRPRDVEKDRKKEDMAYSLDTIIEKARGLDQKIVFYAGQNDWGSGMQPREWLPKPGLHSPLYSDTLDALNHLSQLAEKNNWHILFKPHPLVENRHKEFQVEYPDRVSLVLGADIFRCMDEADLTATILSGLSYIALIHGHTLVMLGRNQLRMKKCAHEPATREDTETYLLKAFETGFHGVARAHWRKHVARLCKHYLYAFDKDVAKIIGRDAGEIAAFLIEQSRMQAPAEGADSLQPYLESTRKMFESPSRSIKLPYRVRLQIRLQDSCIRIAQSLPDPVYRTLRSAYRRLKEI